ncbi:hypothetical protein ACWHAM_23375 [Paenibacillus terrae]
MIGGFLWLFYDELGQSLIVVVTVTGARVEIDHLNDYRCADNQASILIRLVVESVVNPPRCNVPFTNTL